MIRYYELQNSWPEGRTKALRPSTLNHVEAYINPRISVSLAKITWILEEGV
jgi:hypothetical protein